MWDCALNCEGIDTPLQWETNISLCMYACSGKMAAVTTDRMVYLFDGECYVGSEVWLYRVKVRS